MSVQYGNYIDGRWQEPKSGQWFESLNPATGEVIGRFAASNEEDANAAVESAARAFLTWSKKLPAERVKVIYKLMDLIERDKEKIAKALTCEQGKPLTESIGEPARSIHECRFMVGESMRMHGMSVPSDRHGVTSTVYRDPIGVVAAITPWNFPFLTPIRKVVPALIYGCTVILKPASDTPHVACLLVELLEEAGAPAGTVNLITGGGSLVGDVLSKHPDVKGISFTGSTDVGRKINISASATFKKIQLEMGGKNPAIVAKYHDLPFAANQIVANAFANAGQRCTTISRVLVVEDVAEELERLMAEKISALKVGNGSLEGTQIGPMINERAGADVMKNVEAAIAAGAIAKTGGKRLTGGIYDKGYFIAPTLLTRVTHDMTIAREEVFGPVLSVIRVKDFDEAMKLANDTRYGLTSSLFTDCSEEEFKFISNIQSGMGHINHGTSSEGHLPFGGVKESGLGPYSIGDSNKEFYTNLKVIYNMYLH
ncbi:MAG: aldehyde dehydrogenase family protein [Acetivibrionales bacterium]|jgi:acyl-CoA reductase-like NAD-dependent aldehyde dehydrogenase